MARHSSNRDRIARMALEAEVTAKEKAEAAAKKAAAPKKKAATRKGAAPPVGKVRVVWLLCDQAGRTVETYPYAEEQAARAEAEKRTEDTGKPHFVKQGDQAYD